MIRSLLLFVLFSVQLHAHEAEPLSRAYGYVIGDILVQRVALHKDGSNIELAQLPIEQRVGPWVRRLSSQLSTDEREMLWLTMRYQVINAPFQPQEIALPTLALITTSSEPLQLASQPISIMPLTLERQSTNNNLPFMLPDQLPGIANSKLAWKRLHYTLLALLITVLAWFGWWLLLRQRDKTTLPFSKAMHQLHQLRKSSPHSIDDTAEAWSAVHEAFNTLAGQTLSSQTALNSLKNHRWLTRFKPEIESFYKASDNRFFNPETTPTPFELFIFCKALSNAEKRNSDAIVTGMVN